MATTQGISNAHISMHQPGVDLRWPASAIWRSGEPAVRKIGIGDLKDALAKGFADFMAVPTHVLFLCVFYPIVGLILFRVAFGYHLLPLVFPLLAGLALIGPVAAVGLYELSRRREQGLDVSASQLFEVYRSPSIGAIVRLGLVLFAIFVAWMMTTRALYMQTFDGAFPASVADFTHQMSTTPAGRELILTGNAIGFLFALVTLVISVVSFPMLVDRNVGVATAVRTSVRAVLENPVTMAAWGLLVAVLLLLGALPFFFGLAVVFPVLGHATWHLYRKVVSADEVI
ncbi:DUF2189 domain-containing protein [Hyphomicrobium sp. LHD-15]|uniref:DUF2189 domain-containing protein n=1 Tax=Hyphomicrobium sp. LHD-15 TaxID=3072142 RepID=UPI00280DAA79|nr:DUF2189 domain-containing protein [Hyphomicrobium sp. LHD-15]MDQ8700729.1 DUF2189 domain-containing protein [Hyphomicrobium sp. LHD-15]